MSTADELDELRSEVGAARVVVQALGAENAEMKATLDRIEELADQWASVKEVNGNGLEVSIVSPVYHLLSRKLRDALRPEHEYDDEGNDVTLLYALSDTPEGEG